jgi:hypothetical protein
VLSEEKDATREQILLDTPGLPIVAITQTSNGAVCVSKTAERREDNPYYWDVTCEFETQPLQQEDEQNNNDPTTWVALIKIAFESKEKVLAEDTSGDPIVNSAGQQFETPLTITQLIPVLKWVQYEYPTLSLSDIMARNNTVNSASKFGAEAKTLLCNVLSAERGYYYRVPAWKVEYQLRYDADTWKIPMLDVGTRFRQDVNSEWEPYLEDAHRVLGNLDGNGLKTANNGDDPPAILEFDVYKTDNFSWIRAR